MWENKKKQLRYILENNTGLSSREQVSAVPSPSWTFEDTAAGMEVVRDSAGVL